MIILEKIIKNEWRKALAISTISLAFLILIGNLISGFMRTNVSPYEVLVNQLLIFPSTLLQVLPTACLISSLITSNYLIKTNQLVAIYSTGVTPFEIIKKVFSLGLVMALVQFFIGSYIKPYSLNLKNKLIPNLEEKFRNLEADGLLSSKITNGNMWIKKDDQFIKYQSFDQQNKKINFATVYTVNNNSVIKTYNKSKGLKFKRSWLGEDIIKATSLIRRLLPRLLPQKKIQYQ